MTRARRACAVFPGTLLASRGSWLPTVDDQPAGTVVVFLPRGRGAVRDLLFTLAQRFRERGRSVHIVAIQ